jgi:hypothetical protein
MQANPSLGTIIVVAWPEPREPESNTLGLARNNLALLRNNLGLLRNRRGLHKLAACNKTTVV